MVTPHTPTTKGDTVSVYDKRDRQQQEYQTKAERSYNDGRELGFKEGVQATLCCLFAIAVVVFICIGISKIHDDNVADEKADFGRACNHSGEIQVVDEPQGGFHFTYSGTNSDGDVCRDNKTGHIIMIRSEEGTWKR